jgi:hypothetical protein
MKRSRRHRATSLQGAARRAGRGSVVATVVIMSLGLLPTAAHADADPASDVLLIQGAFFPYEPAVPPKLAFALNTLLGTAARAGLPLKVAIIGSRTDLGGVPVFFGHPQKYAEFLDHEISFNNHESLLVVMPAGFGIVGAGSLSTVANVPVDSSHGSSGLTRSAILAVVALAHASGHPISAPSIPANAGVSHHGFPVAVLFVLPIALLAVIGFTRLRGANPHDRPEPPHV